MARRGRYCWIFIELCLVALIGWAMLDEVVITTYKMNMNPGYDLDRLVTFQLAEYPSTESEENDSEMNSPYTTHLNRILDRVRSDNRVEAVTITDDNALLGNSVSINSIPVPKDTLQPQGMYYTVHFWPNTDFFKTFGISNAYSAHGEIFEEPSMSGRDLIVSESVARFIAEDESAIGHFLEEKDPDHKKRSTIVGVVNDCVYKPTFAISPIVYKTQKLETIDKHGIEYIYPVIRLKPGVNVDKFIEEYSPVVNKELRSGQIYAHSLTGFREIAKSSSRDITNSRFIKSSVAVFFLVNVLLCMIGTFYLQTRKRAEETGVMRTFGASRSFILREMLGEGFVIVTLAWVLGCFLYWLHIKDEGLLNLGAAFSDEAQLVLREMMPTWADHFNTHFAIVSFILYFLMLACVLIGIYIPARKIASINPVDALRDE